MNKRGWVNQWTSTLVAIEPPDTIKNHYGGLVKAGRVRAADEPQSLPQALGDRIKVQRDSQKLSQFMVAEQIGISQPLLSKLENGYQVNLSKPMRKKIEDWLHSNEQPQTGS